jgi:hypothetical protein
MIPKVIHYCWFGEKQKPPEILQCIESWKVFLPDYQIQEWNEKNFNLDQVLFTSQAAQAKKWAFVSDYVRVWALNQFGGIYFDADVLVYKNFDGFLDHRAFTGFESIGYPFTAVWGSEKDHILTRQLIDYYSQKKFINEKGELQITPNTKMISKMITDYGINPEFDGLQFGEEGLVVYPSCVFCLGVESAIHYSTHLFLGTWVKDEQTKIEMQPYLQKKYLTTIKNTRFLYGQPDRPYQRVKRIIKSAIRLLRG